MQARPPHSWHVAWQDWWSCLSLSRPKSMSCRTASNELYHSKLTISEFAQLLSVDSPVWVLKTRDVVYVCMLSSQCAHNGRGGLHFACHVPKCTVTHLQMVKQNRCMHCLPISWMVSGLFFLCVDLLRVGLLHGVGLLHETTKASCWFESYKLWRKLCYKVLGHDASVAHQDYLVDWYHCFASRCPVQAS